MDDESTCWTELAVAIEGYLVLEGHNATIRSCWLCNPAHEHLKSHKALLCAVCGRLFMKGRETQFRFPSVFEMAASYFEAAWMRKGSKIPDATAPEKP